MTTEEFSDNFDVLLASGIEEAEFGSTGSDVTVHLDEYEKSVFLTKAQSEIIIAYFEPSQNKSANGFDGSIKRQYDFSSIIAIEDLTEYTGGCAMDKRAKRFIVPDDMFLCINEQIVDAEGRIYTVVPINFMTYSRMMARPYGYPVKRQAWRLISGLSDSNERLHEVVGRFKGDITYTMRYVRTPRPIILVDLDSVGEGLSINGLDTQTECELPEGVHEEILQRAVELAKASFLMATQKGQAGLANTLALERKSVTDIGQGQVGPVGG